MNTGKTQGIYLNLNVATLTLVSVACIPLIYAVAATALLVAAAGGMDEG